MTLLTSFSSEHSSKIAYWYWIIVGLTLITIVSVLGISTSGSLALVRNVLGSFFLLFIPGYCLVRALFPSKLKNQSKAGIFDKLTTVALSITLSIIAVSLVGLALNYTSWGITLNTLTFSLSSFTVLVATIAIIRENKN